MSLVQDFEIALFSTRSVQEEYFFFNKSFDAEFTTPNSRKHVASLYTTFYFSYHFKFSFDRQNLPPVRHCSRVVSPPVSYLRAEDNFTHKVNCRWDLRSSGTLRSTDWQLVTDDSGQSIGPIFDAETSVITNLRCVTSHRRLTPNNT